MKVNMTLSMVITLLTKKTEIAQIHSVRTFTFITIAMTSNTANCCYKFLERRIKDKENIPPDFSGFTFNILRISYASSLSA
jgi:hypothetical protein